MALHPLVLMALRRASALWVAAALALAMGACRVDGHAFLAVRCSPSCTIAVCKPEHFGHTACRMCSMQSASLPEPQCK